MTRCLGVERGRAQIDEGERLPDGLSTQESPVGRRNAGQFGSSGAQRLVNRMRADPAKPVLAVVKVAKLE
jgi:hypothetical protein